MKLTYSLVLTIAAFGLATALPAPAADATPAAAAGAAVARSSSSLWQQLDDDRPYTGAKPNPGQQDPSSPPQKAPKHPPPKKPKKKNGLEQPAELEAAEALEQTQQG